MAIRWRLEPEISAAWLPVLDGPVAFNPETGTMTEGKSIDEALANLSVATSLDLEEFPAGDVQDFLGRL